jgi:hypothetical protein
MPQLGQDGNPEGGPLGKAIMLHSGFGGSLACAGVSQALWVDRSSRLEPVERFHFA